MRRRESTSIGTMVLALGLSLGSAVAVASESDRLRIVDLTPRFLEFHARAKDVEDADERFALWQEHYNFVALPPGLPDRDERAREMLDAAWPRYGDVIDRIEAGVAGLSPGPGTVVGRVAELLDLDDERPAVSILYFVGMFDDNAFFAAQPDGTLFVALPAEMTPERRELAMAHEFMHAFHHALSAGVPDADGTVGALVLSEGIAMHGTRALFPEVPDARHLGGAEGWAEACHGRSEQILAQLPEYFDAEGPDARNRFTLGEGVTGLEREAYCAGWHLVGQLLEDGWTLAELARLTAPEVTAVLTSRGQTTVSP